MTSKWIKYPVKYDREDNVIVDGNNMVVALISWPNCMLPIEVVDGRGEEIARLMNGGKVDEVISYAVSKPETVDTTQKVSIVEKTASFVRNAVGLKEDVRKYRVYVDGDGVEHKMYGRGRPKVGWVRKFG